MRFQARNHAAAVMRQRLATTPMTAPAMASSTRVGEVDAPGMGDELGLVCGEVGVLVVFAGKNRERTRGSLHWMDEFELLELF